MTERVGGRYINAKNKNIPTKMKPSTITFKTTPHIKRILERLAKEDFRSLSSQVEMIVVKYLESKGIDWREDTEDAKD